MKERGCHGESEADVTHYGGKQNGKGRVRREKERVCRGGGVLRWFHMLEITSRIVWIATFLSYIWAGFGAPGLSRRL